LRVVRWSLFVVVVAAALLGAVPARAAVPTTWSQPVDLDRVNEVGGPVGVGIDRSGNALAIWQAQTGTAETILRSATRAAGGEWSAPVDRTDRVEISDPVAFAEDSSGRAVVAWSQWNSAHFTVHVTTVTAEGIWSAPLELSPPDESSNFVHATIDEGGHAVVAWNSDAGIKAATCSFGAGWSALDTLTSDSQATAVQVSSNGSGDVTATWWRQFDHEVQATTRPAGGAWSAPEMLSGAGIETSPASIAQGPGAGAVASWSELHGSDWVVVTADRSAAGVWGPPVELVGVTGSASEALRTDASGNSVLVLVHEVVGSGNEVVGTTRPASGTWSAPASLSPAGIDVRSQALATNPGGDAVLAMDLDGSQGTSSTWVRSLPLGGSWSTAVPVSDGSVYTGGSQAALDDAGDAVVTWSTAGTIPPKVQAVRSPAPVAPLPAPRPIFRMPSFTG
jgi:hypothetical protein